MNNKISKKYFYYNILITFFVSLIIYLYFLFAFNEIKIKGYLVTLIIVFFVFIYLIECVLIYFNYKNIIYDYNDLEINLKKGFLFKKNISLKYLKIHTINIKQGLIQKLFNLKTIEIDSGSALKFYKAEIKITNNSYLIDELYNFINKKININDEKTNININDIYKYKVKDKILIHLIYSSILIIIYLLIFLVLYFGLIKNSKDFLSVNLYFIISLVYLYFLTLLIQILNLYDYKAFRMNDVIYISYGLFVKYNYQIKIENIKSITIKYGLIKRLFKIAEIKLDAIGYNNYNNNENNQNNNGIFIPFVKTKLIKDTLNKLVNEYNLEDNYILPKKNAFKYFLILPLIITYLLYFTILIFLLSVFINTNLNIYLNKFYIVSILIFLFIFIINYLFSYIRYKNNKINISNDKIIVYQGLFKNAVIIKNNNLIGIEKKTTYFRKKENIYSYKIHFYNNNQLNKVTVNNLNEDVFNLLLNCIKF